MDIVKPVNRNFGIYQLKSSLDNYSKDSLLEFLDGLEPERKYLEKIAIGIQGGCELIGTIFFDHVFIKKIKPEHINNFHILSADYIGKDEVKIHEYETTEEALNSFAFQYRRENNIDDIMLGYELNPERGVFLRSNEKGHYIGAFPRVKLSDFKDFLEKEVRQVA